MTAQEFSATAVAEALPKKQLGLEPHIDSTARVRESTLGIYTAVGPRTTMS